MEETLLGLHAVRRSWSGSIRTWYADLTEQ